MSTKRMPLLSVAFCTVLFGGTANGQEESLMESSGIDKGPDPARIEVIARMLPESPRGLGRPITDREAWTAIASSAGGDRIIARAESVMSTLNTGRTGGDSGTRSGRPGRRDRMSSRPLFTIAPLVLAECIENSGRFLPLIEKTIHDYAAFPTWVSGGNLSRWSKIDSAIVGIDLSAAQSAWNLATIYYWLGDRLSEETRALIRDELDRRIFKPFEGSVQEDFPNCWWLKGRNKNNWNPVCLGCVSGAALAVIESRQRRAFFVASAEKYVQAYLNGYQEDGFCTEGLGYWVYGFGHFVNLAESITQATDGQLDLLESPKTTTIARFGDRMKILPGVYPAYADCRTNQQPDKALTAFLYGRYGWGKPELLASGPAGRRPPSQREMDFSLMRLYQWGVHNFPNSATARRVVDEPALPSPLRDWFVETGAYVGRPTQERRDRALGVAFKGGHNGEHHNHNDVGTYVVALKGKALLLDPGREPYTNRTFSARRYESNVLNSYGHAVPRVAGKLQSEGRSAAVRVVETDFSDEMDRVVLDLSAAYEVEEMQELKRTFAYSRQGDGSLTVIDGVVFSSPQHFETALITLSDWRQVGENELVVGEGSEAVRILISSEGGDFKIQAEEIQDGANPTRLGIAFTEPVARGIITVKIVPVGSGP